MDERVECVNTLQVYDRDALWVPKTWQGAYGGSITKQQTRHGFLRGEQTKQYHTSTIQCMPRMPYFWAGEP